MKTIKYFTALLLPIVLMCSCVNDSAENPSFGKEDMPRIYGDWIANLVRNFDEVIEIKMVVSPTQGSTFKWTLNDEVISTTKDLSYKLTQFGEFTLKFEVERNGVVNSRTAALVVVKPFVAKTYNKISLGFLSANGKVSDVPWEQITHLVVSSSVIKNAMPDVVQAPDPIAPMPDLIATGLKSLVATAHNNGVYILLEYSGVITYLNGAPAYGSATFADPASSVGQRANLIKAMVKFATDNNFDGINVYMDKSTDPSYGSKEAGLKLFFDELALAAPTTTPRGDFFLTMSLYIGWTSAALKPFVTNVRYNWYNVLAFGAENTTPGTHSSFWGLLEPAVSGWVTAGVPKEKLIPVAPAFGLRYHGNIPDYTWGNLWQYTEYIPYKKLCADHPDAPTKSKIEVDNGIFYDGINDVKAKAEYAVAQGWGGMGLWSVESDIRESGKSLMQQINTSLGN